MLSANFSSVYEKFHQISVPFHGFANPKESTRRQKWGQLFFTEIIFFFGISRKRGTGKRYNVKQHRQPNIPENNFFDIFLWGWNIFSEGKKYEFSSSKFKNFSSFFLPSRKSGLVFKNQDSSELFWCVDILKSSSVQLLSIHNYRLVKSKKFWKLNKILDFETIFPIRSPLPPQKKNSVKSINLDKTITTESAAIFI